METPEWAEFVLEWALAAGANAPPRGIPASLAWVSDPPERLSALLADLSRITAAREGLSWPPWGDKGSLPLEGLLMVAAVGLLHAPMLAAELLAALSPSKRPMDWLFRHGLAQPALPFCQEDLADEIRAASPLTSLLDHPTEARAGEALGVLRRILEHPTGRGYLASRLGTPARDAGVRAWREDLLHRLLAGSDLERGLVLDVYECMMVDHKQAAMAQVNEAREIFSNPKRLENEASFKEAATIARMWGPLFQLEREELDSLRKRRYLAYEYRQGIALFKMAGKLGVSA